MTILEKIKQHKLIEVKKRKELFTIDDFETTANFQKKPLSMKSFIKEKSGIIAEFKRQSPSKGIINDFSNVAEVVNGYKKAGVSGISCLTDETFFGAKETDFENVIKISDVPVLRKDFIVDIFQIYESKAMGADVILLIAKMLNKQFIDECIDLSHQLKMEVLLETHTETEVLTHLNTKADLVGINNRDLNTFKVSVENSSYLANLLPNHVLKIAESGIESIETIQKLKQNDFDGFLIGEYFMRDKNPAQKCIDFIKQL